ncbi:xylulokinase [Fundicoccus culcitae]|uniref:Xylulose kinase n=1 Tax=Fundicoccus culcitae TaxID=2969821 RepID=A0ABY5P9D3_9LACT|nr:xylulokinase [Fundicoccus culcitae]UUX35366.1 xylulokinase [Fundicoccus culcitae]
MSYVLGIDLGTSSLKGLLMNQQGEIVATASSNYDLHHPAPGFSEQNPEDWYTACVAVMEKLNITVTDFKEQLEGISFSGQMHSLVLLDEDLNVLRPAILWNDVRTTAECEFIMSTYSNELYAITKNRALEGFTLPKVLWVQKHEPDIWQKVAHLLLPKDYLRLKLTGQLNMDYADAAGTLLFDINAKQWSQSILDQFQIPINILPTAVESIAYVGDLLADSVPNITFEKTVKVFAGGADNACAALGAGVMDETVGMSSIGTSGVFLAYEQNGQSDYQGKLHLFNHTIPNSYYSMGVTLAAGHSLSWFKETFAADLSFDELLEDIADVPIGSKGLLFTPYISGERTPHIDSTIRGSFIGIDASHSLKHFTRSVIEGITFSLKDVQMLMTEAANKSFEKIISVGGGAQNPTWLQIQADVFNAPVVALKSEQGPGLGAAMIATLGLGWFPSVEACVTQCVTYKNPVNPIPENVNKYQQIYAVYKTVYTNTKELSRQLSHL